MIKIEWPVFISILVTSLSSIVHASKPNHGNDENVAKRLACPSFLQDKSNNIFVKMSQSSVEDNCKNTLYGEGMEHRTNFENTQDFETALQKSPNGLPNFLPLSEECFLGSKGSNPFEKQQVADYVYLMHRLSEGSKDRIFALLSIDMALGQKNEAAFDPEKLKEGQSYSDPFLAGSPQLVNNLRNTCKASGSGFNQLQKDFWYGAKRVAQITTEQGQYLKCKIGSVGCVITNLKKWKELEAAKEAILSILPFNDDNLVFDKVFKRTRIAGQDYVEPRMNLNQMNEPLNQQRVTGSMLNNMHKKRAAIVDELQELKQATDCFNKESNPKHSCFKKARKLLLQKTPEMDLSLHRAEGLSDTDYGKQIEMNSWLGLSDCRFGVKSAQDDAIKAGNNFAIGAGSAIISGGASIALQGIRVGAGGVKATQLMAKAIPSMKGLEITKNTVLLGAKVNNSSRSAFALASVLVGTNAVMAYDPIKQRIGDCVEGLEGDLGPDFNSSAKPDMCSASEGPAFQLASSRLRRCVIDLAMGVMDLVPLAMSATTLRNSYKALTLSTQTAVIKNIKELMPVLKTRKIGSYFRKTKPVAGRNMSTLDDTARLALAKDLDAYKSMNLQLLGSDGIKFNAWWAKNKDSITSEYALELFHRATPNGTLDDLFTLNAIRFAQENINQVSPSLISRLIRNMHPRNVGLLLISSAIGTAKFTGEVIKGSIILGPGAGSVNAYVSPIMNPVVQTAGQVGNKHFGNTIAPWVQEWLSGGNQKANVALIEMRDLNDKLKKTDFSGMSSEQKDQVFENFKSEFFNIQVRLGKFLPAHLRDGRAWAWEYYVRTPTIFSGALGTFEAEKALAKAAIRDFEDRKNRQNGSLSGADQLELESNIKRLDEIEDKIVATLVNWRVSELMYGEMYRKHGEMNQVDPNKRILEDHYQKVLKSYKFDKYLNTYHDRLVQEFEMLKSIFEKTDYDLNNFVDYSQ